MKVALLLVLIKLVGVFTRVPLFGYLERSPGRGAIHPGRCSVRPEGSTDRRSRVVPFGRRGLMPAHVDGDWGL
jgi:hypothetical protein